MADGTRAPSPFGEPGRFTYSCARCGTPTTRRKLMSGKRVFCSPECRELGRTHPDRVCPQCGVTFNPRYGRRAGTAVRIFCSHACYLASIANKVTKTCLVCGKEFTISASIADRYQACSTACRTAGTEYVACERCGKRFPADKRKPRSHCSEECRRPPFIVPCRTCGKEFRKVVSDEDRQFCSLACCRKFIGETKLEARVRTALEHLGIEFVQEHEVGRWSIDFAIPRHKIAIEADGDYWHRLSADRDARRDRSLNDSGWTVIRLAENEVKASGDLGQLIIERIRKAASIGLSDLLPADGKDAVTGGARPRRSAWKRLANRPNGGQVALWDSDVE